MNITMLMTAGIGRPPWMRYFPIARQLAARGHHVRLLALHPDYAHCTARRQRIDGVEVWFVGQMHAHKQGSVPQRFAPLHLIRILATSVCGMTWATLCSPADVYHLCKPQPINGLAALIAITLVRRKPFYVDCDDDETVSNRFDAAWQRHVFGVWQWLLIRMAKGITVNTTVMRQRIAHQTHAPHAYVPNGVDQSQCVMPHHAQLAALRQSLGFANKQVIAYVGTLTLQNHPILLLIDAFIEIAHHHDNTDDVMLLLIGGGEDLPTIRQYVKDASLHHRVRFTGHIPQAHVPLFLALADMSVDPVYDNNVARCRSPLKLFESMALGIPVVTGNVGDRALWLDNGNAGVLVAPNDSHALAEGLLVLLNNPSRREQQATACHRNIQRYTWDTLATAWEAIYPKQ